MQANQNQVKGIFVSIDKLLNLFMTEADII